MIVFGLHLGLLPISGTGSWQHFVMPGIVLAFTAVPALTRLTRSGMIEALASDYIRTARAKGLSRSRILFKHALRNAAIPVCDRGGPARIHARRLNRDRDRICVARRWLSRLGEHRQERFSVVQAVVLVLASIYVGLTLLADILNAMLDPRLRSDETDVLRPRCAGPADLARDDGVRDCACDCWRCRRRRSSASSRQQNPFTQDLGNRLVPPFSMEDTRPRIRWAPTSSAATTLPGCLRRGHFAADRLLDRHNFRRDWHDVWCARRILRRARR